MRSSRGRRSASAVRPTACGSRTPCTAPARRWSSTPAGSATCSTTGRARSGGTTSSELGQDRHRHPVRRARPRPVRPRRHRPQPRGAARRPRGGRRRRRARALRAAGHGAGRPGGHRVRRPASRAGRPAGLLRQLRRRVLGRPRGATQLDDTFDQLIKVGWERPTPEFRRVFTCMMIPRRHRGADGLARRAPAAWPPPPRPRRAATAARRRPTLTALLGGARRAHAGAALARRPDEPASSTRGYLAAGIPGARLVALESDNHIVLEDEPAWPVFLREVAEFLAPRTPPPARRRSGADPRAAALRARGRDAAPRRATG